MVRKLALALMRTLGWKVLVNRRVAVSLMRRRAPKRAARVKALSLERAATVESGRIAAAVERRVASAGLAGLKREVGSRGVVRVAADLKIVAGSRDVRAAVDTTIVAGSREAEVAVDTKIVAGLKAALAIGRVTRELAARRGGMIALDVNSTVGRVAGRAVSLGVRRRAKALMAVPVAREASTVVSNPGVTVLGGLEVRADTRVVVDAGLGLEVVAVRVGRAAALSHTEVRRVGGSRKHPGTNSANLG